MLGAVYSIAPFSIICWRSAPSSSPLGLRDWNRHRFWHVSCSELEQPETTSYISYLQWSLRVPTELLGSSEGAAVALCDISLPEDHGSPLGCNRLYLLQVYADTMLTSEGKSGNCIFCAMRLPLHEQLRERLSPIRWSLKFYSDTKLKVTPTFPVPRLKILNPFHCPFFNPFNAATCLIARHQLIVTSNRHTLYPSARSTTSK